MTIATALLLIWPALALVWATWRLLRRLARRQQGIVRADEETFGTRTIQLGPGGHQQKKGKQAT